MDPRGFKVPGFSESPTYLKNLNQCIMDMFAFTRSEFSHWSDPSTTIKRSKKKNLKIIVDSQPMSTSFENKKSGRNKSGTSLIKHFKPLGSYLFTF